LLGYAGDNGSRLHASRRRAAPFASTELLARCAPNLTWQEPIDEHPHNRRAHSL
jgi:hypothetical protein